MPADQPAAADRHSPPEKLRVGQLMRLSALWFGLQFFWTSNQLVLLPKKVRMFVLEASGNVDQLGLYRSLIDSVGAALVIFTQLAIGFISDHAESRLGRRRPFILFGVLTGLGGIVFFMLAPGYWWLFAAYMIIQVGLNTASVPFQSLLPDLVPERQHSQAGSHMGLNHVGGQLVGLLAYIGMVLAFGDDLQSGWLSILLPAYIVVLLLTGALVVFGIDEHGWMQGARRKVAESIATLRILPGTIVRYQRRAGTLLGTIARDYMGIDLRQHPNFMWLALSRFAMYFGYTTFLDWVAYYVEINLDGAAWLRSLGLSDSLHGIVLPAMLVSFLVTALAGNLASSPLSSRVGKKAVITGGAILAIVMFIPLIFTSNVWVAIGSGVVLGVGWGAFIAADWAFACTVMPKEMAGSFMGLWTITGLLPQTLSPLISGPVRDLVYNNSKLGMGEHGAEAFAHQVLFSLVIVYFIVGIWMLKHVKEERIKAEG
jgi:Na+/melibiose symporter-like transporter